MCYWSNTLSSLPSAFLELFSATPAVDTSVDFFHVLIDADFAGCLLLLGTALRTRVS